MTPPPDANRPEEARPAIAPVRIVVVGTGTGIGKTHLSVALVAYLARAGRQVCGLKPIESGVPPGAVGEDATALAAAGVFHVKQPQPYALPDPVSPHLAARRLGVLHDVAACVLALKVHGIVAPPVVVLQTPAAPDDSTGTNAAELVTLGTVPRAFTMPRGDPGSPECQAATGAIVEALAG